MLHKKSINFYSSQEYFIYQIANAQIREYPWTHVIFDKIFDDELYELILDNLPDETKLIDITTVKKHPSYYNHNRFILNDYDALNKTQRTFWTMINNIFLDGKLKSALLNKFKFHIENRIGPQFINYIEFYDTFQLTKDKIGYKLESHPDAFNKIFTIVINLPKNNDNTNMGTVIYSENHDIIYQSEYKRNSGFGVFRSDNSWHGVEETSEDRWTIQYTIWGKDKV